MQHLFTITDVQQILHVSRATVYRLRDRGEIRFAHVGRAVRIPREDVEKLVASLTV